MNMLQDFMICCCFVVLLFCCFTECAVVILRVDRLPNQKSPYLDNIKINYFIIPICCLLPVKRLIVQGVVVSSVVERASETDFRLQSERSFPQLYWFRSHVQHCVSSPSLWYKVVNAFEADLSSVEAPSSSC
jgi:hypothetical protein